MAENKKSILIYCDLIHTVDSLEDVEAGKLFKHLLRYVNDLNPEPPDRITRLLFEPIKQSLKRDLRKWEQKSERNSDIAKAAWSKRKDANAYERKQTKPDEADSDSVIDSDSVSDKDILSKGEPEKFCLIFKGETIRIKPYDFLMQKKSTIIEAWYMNQYRGIDVAKFEQLFNLECNGYNFEDDNHLQNTARVKLDWFKKQKHDQTINGKKVIKSENLIK